MSDAVPTTTPCGDIAPIPRHPWTRPQILTLPKLHQLTLASAIGGGGGTGGGGSTVFGLLVAAGLALSACGPHEGTTGPTGGELGPPTAVLTCRADVARTLVDCSAPMGSGGTTVIGGQGIRVALRSTDASFDDGTDLFKAAVSVQNLGLQPLGTLDGTTPDTNGVKVFFTAAPIGAPTGLVTLPNAYIGDLTATGQSYYKYDVLLASQEVSDTQYWHFQLDPLTTSFTFTVLVYAARPAAGGVSRWFTDRQMAQHPINGVAGFGPTGLVLYGENADLLIRQGTDWISRPDPSRMFLRGGLGSLVAHAANDIYALGYGDSLRHWDGISWQSIDELPGAPGLNQARSIAAGNATSGIYAIGGSSVRRFNGTGWTTLAAPPGLAGILSVATSAAGRLYLADHGGHVWSYDGSTYADLGASGATDPNFILATAPDDVWIIPGAVHQPNHIRHWDGTSWSLIALPEPGASYLVTSGAVAGTDDLYLAAYHAAFPGDGLIWHWDGSSWTTEVQTFGPSFRSLWARNANEVWGVGVDGIAWMKSAGSWTQVGGTADGLLQAVWAAGPDDVHAGSQSGIVYHWDGTTWTERFNTGRGITSIWGGNYQDVWFAVRDYGAWRWNGTSFTFVPHSAGDAITSKGVAGFSPLDVWFVGDGGGIAHWDGVGFQTYVAGDNSVTTMLNSVWAAAGTGFAVTVGNGGTIYHCSCSTNSWSEVPSPTTADLNGVWGNGPSSVWAVGNGGTILRWEGVTWASFPSPTTVDLMGIWGGMANDVYAVGAGGTVLHYDGTSWTLMPQVQQGTPEFRAVTGSLSDDVFLAGAGIVRGVR